MADEYTYDYLKQFLNKVTQTAPVTSLHKMSDHDRCVFLRHDVDFSVEFAYQLFQMEREFPISSTFFFMTTSYSYNIRDPRFRPLLREMVKDGFEIGLHFDPTVYPEIPDTELEEKLNFEKSIIEEIIEDEVRSVSLHNPSVHGQYPLFKNMLNAYAPDIFSDAQYLSDSCFDMRGKNLLEFADKASEHSIQVLLHPMHWHEKKLTYHETFDVHFKALQEQIRSGFSINKAYLAELEAME